MWPARRVERPPAEYLPRLAPAPRRVPFGLRLRMLVAGPAAFAWFWLAITGPISTIFLRNADLSWWRFRGPVESTRGVVTACDRTGASEGGSKGRSGTPIYANRFTFERAGESLEGVSYATGRCLAAGTAVAVEYPADAPERSRIVGMRSATFGPEVLFVAIFPLIGFGMLAFASRSRWRELRLLGAGKLGHGTLVGEEATNVSVNKQPVMKLRFDLVSEAGTHHEVVVKTHRTEALKDDPRERLLYDPASPQVAVAWDLLPGPPRVDATGAIEPPGFASSAVALLLPALAMTTEALALALLG